jgi:hypothetical protein
MAEGNNIKMLIKRSSIVLLIAFIFCTQSVKAQFSFYTGYDGYFDDNIYNNYLSISDFVSSFSFGAGYDFESSNNNLNFYYDGNLTRFNENVFKSSATHKAGIVNTFFAGDGNPLNVGANYSWRNYEEGYTVYDWSQLSLYANYKQYTTDNDFILAGYVYNGINYLNLEIFSYNEHKAFIKYKSLFSSKTSLLIGIQGDFKDYMQNYQSSSLADNALQVSSFIQLAQSLSDNTGLSVYAQYRKNIISGNRYINIDEFFYYEDEILYDQYSNEGYNGGIKIKQMLSPILILSGYANYVSKYFPNLPVADIQGNSFDYNREDNQFKIGVQLEASLGGIIPGLYGDINWDYIKNNSNDTFYKYNNQVFSAGLEFVF